MQYTLSLHNGGQNCVRQAHNSRRFMPPNADSNKSHNNIYFRDLPIREAYNRLFDSAVDEFNKRQIAGRHRERIINDYYAEMSANPKKQAAYELIVQIGGKADGGAPDLAVRALTEYYRGWKSANPNLVCFGAYIHMDESTPHLHIDYIPVAESKRGMHVKNSLTGALKAQGFVTKRMKDTAQMQWEQSERDRFRGICTSLGIDVAKQGIGRDRHFTTAEYKQYRDRVRMEQEQLASIQIDKIYAEQDLEITNHVLAGKHDKLQSLQTETNKLQSLHDKLVSDVASLNELLADRRVDAEQWVEYNKRLQRKCNAVKHDIERYTETFNQLAGDVKQQRQDAAKLKTLCADFNNAINERQARLRQLIGESTQHITNDTFRQAVSLYEPRFANDVLALINQYGDDVQSWPDADNISDLVEMMNDENRMYDEPFHYNDNEYNYNIEY